MSDELTGDWPLTGEPRPSVLRDLLNRYAVYPSVPRLTEGPDPQDERGPVLGMAGNRVAVQNQGLSLEDIDPNFVTYLGYGLANGDFSYSSELDGTSEYWEIVQPNSGMVISVAEDPLSPGGHVIRLTPTGVTSGSAGYLISARVPVADTWPYAAQVTICARNGAVGPGDVSIAVSADWYDENDALLQTGIVDPAWNPTLADGAMDTRVFNIDTVFKVFNAAFVAVRIELGGLSAGNPLDICSVALSSRRPYDLIVDPATGPGAGGSPGSFSGARSIKSANQSIAAASDVALTWLTEAYDTNAYHDTAANQSRWTAPYTGKYHINAGAQFADATTGVVQLWIRLNGTTDYWRTLIQFLTGTTNERINTGGDLDLTAGDYLEAFVRHGEAGALNVAAGNDTYFNIHLIGGLPGPQGPAGPAGPSSHALLTGLATGDDHTQYQKESEKGLASGYVGIDSLGKANVGPFAAGANAAIEIRADGGNPYIDFTRDLATDYDMRIIATAPDALDVIGGELREATSRVWTAATHGSTGDPHSQYATDSDLTTHAATAGHTHPNLATHDALGLATDAELTAHAGTSHGVTAHSALTGLTANDHTQYPLESLNVWTPALTPAVPSGFSVAYTTNLGRYIKHGKLVTIWWTILTNTWTLGSSSGQLQLTGLPFPAATAAGQFWLGTAIVRFTKAGYTQVASLLQSGLSSLIFRATGTGVNVANMVIGDFPTGVQVTCEGSLSYETT